MNTIGTSLKDLFMGAMEECHFAENLSERLANAGLDSWPVLAPKLLDLAQRRSTTPEKLIADDLFGAEDAEAFMRILQS